MQNKINLTTPIFCFLPVLVVIPIAKDIIFDFHPGGLKTIIQFFASAIFPSLDVFVIQSAMNGIKTTIAIAIVGWSISILNGLFLGLISSDLFYRTFEIPKFFQKALKSLLAIPRGIHELIWGLMLLQIGGLTPWIAILAISIPYSSLMARVFSDQIDALDLTIIDAIKKSGAGSLETLVTALLPKLFPIIITFGGYRLECALRSATLLGVFGLGGIGTELQLSIQSLQFSEVWTSLWILGIVIFILEKIVRAIQALIRKEAYIRSYLALMLGTISLLLLLSISYLQNFDISYTPRFNLIELPTANVIINAITSLDLITLTIQTINISILAAGVAIGFPPLILFLFPSKLAEKVISTIWLACRIIPAPLIALLLLLTINPSISIAGLALGIHNMGIMGKILQESVSRNNNSTFTAINLCGASKRSAWLYGKLSQQSKAYLIYSFYRIDVILRETSVIGVVGGVGLGWQLQESLSSFAWEEVLIIVGTFLLLTLLGEAISEKLKYFIDNHSLAVRNISPLTPTVTY